VQVFRLISLKSVTYVQKDKQNGEFSDDSVLDLLQRIKSATDRDELRRLSEQLQRVIFHRQYRNG